MNEVKAKNMELIAGLDGLRAIAILVIVLYHMFPAAVRGGYLGVTLFFVLSGYLLSFTAMRAEAQGGFSAGRFYLRRVRRIFPALLLTVGLTLGAIYLWFPDLLTGLRQETLSVLLGYQNWRQIVQSDSYFTRIANTSPFTHLWSLAVEMQYYLVWPLLFGLYRLLKKHDREPDAIGVLFALAIISAVEMALLYRPGEDPSRVYYGTDTRVHALLLGSALGFLRLPERRPLLESDGWTLFGVCLPLLTAMILLVDGQSSAAYYGLIPLSALLFSGTIALCADRRLPFGRWLDCAPLKWLGQRSYEIYLVMYPILVLVPRWRPVDNAALLSLIEVGLMLLLASVIHALSKPSSWAVRPGRKKLSKLTRPALWVTVLMVGLSGYVLAAAPDVPADRAALEQELAQNRAQIEQPAPTPVPTPEPSAAPAALDPASVTMIGDSVMLGALPALQNAVPGCVVDALTSRQIWDANAVIDALEANGQLGSTIVLALGTNGYFDPPAGQAVIDRLGPERQIYWVTAYGAHLWWQERSNDAIRAVAAANDNVTLIEWDAYAPGHDDWFYSDGIHLVESGQSAYADLIARSIGAAAPAAVWSTETYDSPTVPE